MGNKWTPEQLDAITQRDCNLLVAAAAGAGKTAVLVERIIREITDREKPVDIDRLLVVTFTNAAATEMRERIGNALAAALEADPSSRELQKQMALLDRASIMTLHSFCLEVVRSHFHSLDLDPAFRIADETESTLMKLDILDELFEEKYESEGAGSEFFRLVDSYGGGRDDTALRDIVLSLHRFTRSHPWPEQWLAAQAEAYRLDASACLSSTPWARVLLRSAAAELQGLKALLEKAAAAARRAQGLEPYCGVLAGDIQMLDKLQHLCEAALAAPQEVPATPASEAAACGGSIASSEAPATPASEAAACGGSIAPPEAPAAPASPIPDWDTIHSVFASCEPARLPRCGKDADPNAQDEVKTVRNLMKEKLKKLRESGFNAGSGELLEDFGKLYPLFRYLSGMVCEFEERYAQKKKSKGLLDFYDLEHFCLKVLLDGDRPTAAALELRDRYEEILVDEYQDSNLIQELILGTVSGNSIGRFNLFMVGDVKQSIYRFRQAKPELFLSKYSAYPQEPGHSSRVIRLFRNFRSRPGIISGVNFIFRQVMSSLVGELDYTEEEALNPGALYAEAAPGQVTGGPIELHLVDVTSTAVIPESEEDTFAHSNEAALFPDTDGEGRAAGGHFPPVAMQTEENGSEMDGTNGNEDSSGPEGYEEESPDNIQAEARIVGKRIRELVSGSAGGLDVYDKKLEGYRKAQYRDIVILMRATRNWADVFVDELAAMGIPAYADTGVGYFRTVEVETMLSLLQIIDNPLQDIPLLAVLRSPIGGFDADELADIRLADKSVSYYAAMQLYAKGKQGAETGQGPNLDSFRTEPGPDDRESPGEPVPKGPCRQKALAFLEKLQIWRDTAQFTPTDELVWMLMTETGYYSYVGILPGGPERRANLRMLFERARQYEETSYKGLFHFIHFIDKLRSGGGDMGSARTLGENDNVVRIMSIHKSKGLEFPVVIVSGCGKKFNLRDLNAGILLHQELGYGPDIVDLDRRTVIPSLPRHAIRQKLRLETLSEEMRILYVAFTRAREKLILTGCVRDVKKVCAGWCSIADGSGSRLPEYDMQQAATYLDWIGPALVRHETSAPLRKAATTYGNIRLFDKEESSWEVRLWGMGAAATGKDTDSSDNSLLEWLRSDSDRDAAQSSKELIKRLEWEYPNRKLSGMPAKISVTEVKRRFSTGEGREPEATPVLIQPLTPRPAFLEPEKGLDAARKGSVMHFVMQHLDLKKLARIRKEIDADSDPTPVILSTADRGSEKAQMVRNALYAEIETQLALMEEREQLAPTEAAVVNIPSVTAFFRTPLGIRMLGSDSVRRETAFNIEVKCSEIYRELPQGQYDTESMLLQGVIDCWFEVDDGIVLLDYKTDYVPEGGSELIRERYRIQLEYYAKALEKITGKKVKERYLYLFHTGEVLKC